LFEGVTKHHQNMLVMLNRHTRHEEPHLLAEERQSQLAHCQWQEAITLSAPNNSLRKRLQESKALVICFELSVNLHG
jgi:hypothetical protein